MQTFVILFRGINVGGKNILPMKALVPILEKANFKNIQYYIQTGNIILHANNDPCAEIQILVAKHFDFSPEIITLTEERFIKALQNCPYTKYEGKWVHFYFCKNNARLALDKIEKYQGDSEHYTLLNNVCYLYAPDGIGRSKFVANIELCLDTPATGRNLNTINKINSLLSTN
ncbi:DUF1697 domain-containing protein [Thalassotalea piscium]